MPRPPKVPSREEVARLPLEELVDLVLEAAEEDRLFARKLRERVARGGSPKERASFWRQQMRSLVPSGFVGYFGARKVAAAIRSSLASLERLQEVADVLGDVALYREACRAGGGGDERSTLEIARRELAAGDAAGALRTLDAAAAERDGSDLSLDLRLRALEALGRMEEAQALRWDAFSRTLWRGYFEDYLERIVDAEERSRRAASGLELAEAFPDATVALGFLAGRNELERAARLVRRRTAELDGQTWNVLRPAAVALGASAPEAAAALYRRLVESVLERGESTLYRYAVRDLHAAGAAGRQVSAAASDLASHEEFVAALRARHGRKRSFWKQVEGA